MPGIGIIVSPVFLLGPPPNPIAGLPTTGLADAYRASPTTLWADAGKTTRPVAAGNVTWATGLFAGLDIQFSGTLPTLVDEGSGKWSLSVVETTRGSVVMPAATAASIVWAARISISSGSYGIGIANGGTPTAGSIVLGPNFGAPTDLRLLGCAATPVSTIAVGQVVNNAWRRWVGTAGASVGKIYSAGVEVASGSVPASLNGGTTRTFRMQDPFSLGATGIPYKTSGWAYYIAALSPADAVLADAWLAGFTPA